MLASSGSRGREGRRGTQARGGLAGGPTVSVVVAASSAGVGAGTSRDSSDATSGAPAISAKDAMHRTAQGQPLPQSGDAGRRFGQWSKPVMAIAMPSMGVTAIVAATSERTTPAAAAGPVAWTASSPTIARIDRHRAMMDVTVTTSIWHGTVPLRRGVSTGAARRTLRRDRDARDGGAVSEAHKAPPGGPTP